MNCTNDSAKYIDDVHHVLLNMMKDIHELLEKHHIPYYISGGGMLGMVRHRGFIPWDDDLDISVERKYFNQLKDIFISELPDYYKVVDVDSGIGIWGEIMKVEDSRTEIIEQGMAIPHGVFIDFFALDSTYGKGLRDGLCWKIVALYAVSYSNSKCWISRFVQLMGFLFGKNWLVHLVKYMASSKGKYRTVYFGRQGRRETFPKEVYGIPELHEFEDTFFYFPQGYKNILTQFYGDYMQLPPVDQRHTHILRFRYK